MEGGDGEKPELEEPLRFMILDVTFKDAAASAPCTPPTVTLFGISTHGSTVSCLIKDFLPYFWFPAPVDIEGSEGTVISEDRLQLIFDHFSRFIFEHRQKNEFSSEHVVAEISSSYRSPLMFYRPSGLKQYLQVKVWRSNELPMVAKKLEIFAERNDLYTHGLLWKDRTSYEEGIKLWMRFCCDTAIAGGAWTEIKQGLILPNSQKETRCNVEVQASWLDVFGLTPDITHYMEFIPMDVCQPYQNRLRHSQTSNVKGDLVTAQAQESDSCRFGSSSGTKVCGRNVHDVNDLADLADAKWSIICPLSIVALHVQSASGGRLDAASINGNKRRLHACSKGSDRNNVSNHHCLHADVDDAERADPTDLCCLSGGGSAIPSRDPVLVISNILRIPDWKGATKVCFSYGKHMLGSPPGTRVHVYDTELEMLMAWQDFIREEIDPDVICMFQCKDSLRYIVERLKALRLAPLDIGRHRGHATEVKSVVSYGKHWVRQQARMTATSNQEVFRANIHGRIVIDMLRAILVAYNLTTFTLAECSQVLLGRPKEVLSASSILALWNGLYGGFPRLVRYSLREAEIAADLMERLQTLTEAIEMARVTGLSTGDVLYKAQMVRIQSLLLRSACKEGWLLGGPTIGGQLSGSPFLLHPHESKTTGYYEDPIAVLDFASLYPSVFMAHNLCYTTLVHPKDVEQLSEEEMIVSPTGAHFVGPKLQRGVLPRICGALITARKQAKERMGLADITSDEYAVLDGRQKALKLCSNALYGFTGAGASPQQALPLADSCLTMGAAACKQAVESVAKIFNTAEVIYAQTDSVFIKFKGATIEAAIGLGVKASELLSKDFPSPMVLKFERVLCPFLLLQVNRYAGKQYGSVASKIDDGTLFVRGLESERRDVPPFVRTICSDVLNELLIHKDVKRALEVSSQAIRRLVSGNYSLHDLVMTGGLWRVDGQDIARLASATKSSRKESGSAFTAEEGRGPHVSLAIRMKRQDPDRQFHIGERIPYVLVANSSKLQDEMSADPLAALIHNMPINFHVYLENKLRKPLEAILEHVTEPSQRQELFTTNQIFPAQGSQIGMQGTQALVSRFFRTKVPCLSCRKPLEVPNTVLCEDCIANGAAQTITAVLLAQKQDCERKYTKSHAECLRSHSGGMYGPVLCTNLDCSSFYLRHEAARRLNHIQPMLEKLESEFG